MLPKIPRTSWKKFFKEEEIVRYSNVWNPLSSKPQIKKMEESKEEDPLASTRNPQVRKSPQEGKKNKKNNWRKPYSPSYRIPRIQKDAMDNVFTMAKNLMEFKENKKKQSESPISQGNNFVS
ncbi:hypothetical protein O181_113496 [Austropuccinia psidii MF-1]|uniref:Uncharacterized protein n=1 Tax=Austropuccinia psidii MF-1 TaxID=1389203 RepID=A0A9Q3K4F8_9BASI|nr:hypothetical protein [Austropuccinia psidii MF-1]